MSSSTGRSQRSPGSSTGSAPSPPWRSSTSEERDCRTQSLAELPTLEQRMDDVRAVMDDAGMEQAALMGISEGGALGVLFAATYPGRTSALVLYGCWASMTRTEDYPWGLPTSARERTLALIEDGWSRGDANRGAGAERRRRRSVRGAMGPLPEDVGQRGGGSGDHAHELRHRRACRVGARVRPHPGASRTGDRMIRVEHGRYLAERIRSAVPGAPRRRPPVLRG